MKRDRNFYLSKLPHQGDYKEEIYSGDVDADMRVDVTLWQENIDQKTCDYKWIEYLFKQSDAYFRIIRYLDQSGDNHIKMSGSNTGNEFIKMGIPFQSLLDKGITWINTNEDFE